MSCFCRSLVPYGTGARVDRGRRAELASGCIRRGVAAQQRARGAQEHETTVFAEVQRHDDLDFLDETLTGGELLSCRSRCSSEPTRERLGTPR